MRLRRPQRDIQYALDRGTLLTASSLLLDNCLIWSDDLDTLRKPLGLWLREEAMNGSNANQYAKDIAEKLMTEEWDISA